jgi:rhodanese-related sulfurtransferase
MSDDEVRSVTPAEVPRLLAAGAVLIDVRERDEWDEARIAGAELKPVSEFGAWWAEVPEDRSVVVYCRTGSRSAQVVEALTRQAGMDNVFNLAGGIVAWAGDGGELEEGRPTVTR